MCIYYIYVQIHMYIYIYLCFIKYCVFRRCQWDANCRSRRELSKAIVKSDIRKAVVEIWPFLFRKGVLLGGAGGLWALRGPRGLVGANLQTWAWSTLAHGLQINSQAVAMQCELQFQDPHPICSEYEQEGLSEGQLYK